MSDLAAKFVWVMKVCDTIRRNKVDEDLLSSVFGLFNVPTKWMMIVMVMVMVTMIVIRKVEHEFYGLSL